MEMRRVYLDYAAATPLDPRVFHAMLPYLQENFGNPSSIHAEGRAAKTAVETARAKAAEAIGARPEEVTFTSGVTEAINIALLGALEAGKTFGRHVVTVATEHQATLKALEASGAELTLVPVDDEGNVSVDAVLAAIRPDTVLVTLMYANNEIGVIAPIQDIGKKLAKMRRDRKSTYPLLHTDAAQAPLYLNCNVEDLRVDLMSISGGKMHGPKGTGLLFHRSGVLLAPRFFGGGQEHGLRPGTENVAGIVGCAEALQLAQRDREARSRKVQEVRDLLAAELKNLFPQIAVNGSWKNRLPNNINISLPTVDGEACIVYLDEQGIAASTASSCTAKTSMSHVLRALGHNDNRIRGSIRFTLGEKTTQDDVVAAARALASVVATLSA